jgi:hypothetical protein
MTSKLPLVVTIRNGQVLFVAIHDETASRRAGLSCSLCAGRREYRFVGLGRGRHWRSPASQSSKRTAPSRGFWPGVRDRSSSSAPK